MRLAAILVYVFLISTTGQTARAAICAGILYGDINSLYGWSHPDFLNYDCRDTLQTAIDRQSVTANRYLFDDCFFNARPETAFIAHVPAGTKRYDYFDFDDILSPLASAGDPAIYARARISTPDSGRDAELADKPNPGPRYYNEVVSWLRDVYHAWVPGNQYGSTRLLLLSFGLVGLIGIRRKFKRN